MGMLIKEKPCRVLNKTYFKVSTSPTAKTNFQRATFIAQQICLQKRKNTWTNWISVSRISSR